jgi:hypothetical protein
MVFSKFATWVSAGRVEVAKSQRAESIGFAIPPKRALNE